jgi:serine/threonine protein kinase
MESDTKRVKVTEETAKLVLERLLGRGGFNVALLGNDGSVYRIGAVKYDKEPQSAKLLTRSSAVMKLVTQFKAILGPSTLVEEQAGHWTNLFELQEEPLILMHVLAEFPRLEGYTYFLSRLEFLSGGTVLQTKPTEGGTFSLIYWLWVAQAHIGLRHRDISPDNILVRKYAQPTRFIFNIGREDLNAPSARYVFDAQEMPVITDFDFGTTPVTNAGYRDKTHPKLMYAPPEVILHYMKDLENMDTSPQPVTDDTYDWWSLGMTLFDWWTNNFLTFDYLFINITVFSPMSPKYFKLKKVVLCALTKMTIVYLMLNNALPDAEFFKIPFGALKLDKIVTFAQAQSEKRMRAIPANVRYLLRRLLSWTHTKSERCLRGKAGNLLTVFFKPVYAQDVIVWEGPVVQTGYNEARLTYDYCSPSDKWTIQKRSLLLMEDLARRV